MITCNAETRRVHVGGVEVLPEPSQQLYNHSPDGFSWGYSGSGPAQLALALLLYLTGDQAFALSHYQAFKFEVIAGWPQGNVSVPNKVATRWIELNGGIINTKQEAKA